MRNSNLFKACGAVLCLSLCLALVACSASPEERLNGEWECTEESGSYAMKIEAANGTATFTFPGQTAEVTNAKIVKTDGNDIYLSTPGEENQGLIRFENDNTFTLIDTGKPDRSAPVCNRKR